MEVRTRFAPSPTGYMHIGNLRTALFEYLISKKYNGSFILRIEDTDQKRYVKNSEDLIYKTLRSVNLKHDEGPDIGGNFGPYVQSQRKELYLKYAQKLIKKDKAYYCFCNKNRLEKIEGGYDRCCRNFSIEKINKLINKNTSHVIRQKIPLDGNTSFFDEVFGEITVENNDLDDQILIKTDKLPTYNFANVIDDHLMKITHVVRGSEYLSSTPKYNLLYEAFGWEIPKYVHLPLIMGKNLDGTVSKLSKRHGSVSFEDLIKEGYLPEAILNHIVLLGWYPNNKKEIFSLKELENEFSIENISKSQSIFDFDKLNWFNFEYLKSKTQNELLKLFNFYIKKSIDKNLDYKKIVNMLKNRITKLSEIPEKISFLDKFENYDVNIYINKKSKTDVKSSFFVLEFVLKKLENLDDWNLENLHDLLVNTAKELNLKNGAVMFPVRIAISGKLITPGGAAEILDIIQKEESIFRIKKSIALIQKMGFKKS
ncbi:MAG: glutamate--tRNA ligase [Candidatus Paraimprobicoccus trichonymphae]|uniref:Glutamate--tRNA ligase n=1 Tax=Candidatus Paraimprobicoccus trichonymphae TaxID=3033793 RepID=A0AA48IHG9_9FIRM|nr:MAG: glutamate--tRNA ligase [Candidatus Paraimprobicoccus trichonymphae]